MKALRPLDVLWCIALAVFVIAGVPTASFHGDEAMQIYMSHDYWTAFVRGDPAALMTRPPYEIDSDAQLRILNGTVNRYLIGVFWALAGYNADQLPPRPGWDWGLSYQDNVATHHRPDPAQLTTARLPSALLLAGSVILMFLLGGVTGGRVGAYVVSGLYALHPAVLLNGRRAMQEGSLLFFGILVVLTAAVIASRRAKGEPTPLGVWFGLTLSAALAVASKHSAVVFVVAAFGWIGAAELLRFSRRAFARVVGVLALCGSAAVALFAALSPALWDDPFARLGDLLAVRSRLIEIQISVDPNAPMDVPRRFEQLLVQPFMQPAAHFEVDFWREAADFQAEVAVSAASPFSGIQWGGIGGGVLTFLSLLGALLCVVGVWRGRTPAARAVSLGLLVWLAVSCVSLMANPLPWQRYYLPLMTVSIALIGVPAHIMARVVGRRRQTSINLNNA